MDRVKSLIKNSLIFTIGNFGSKLITFVLVPFYTYFLTANQYGTIDLITTTVLLLIPFASLGLSDSIIRFGMDKDYNQKAIFTSSFLVVVGGSFFCSILLLIVNHFVSISYLYFLIALVFFQSLQILLSTYCRSQEKVIIFTINSIVYTLLICIFSIVFLAKYNLGINGYFFAQIISVIGSILFLFVFGKLRFYFSIMKVNKHLIKEMLFFSLPLIPSGVSWWAINSASRYLILYFVGVIGNGIFAVATKIPSLLNLVQGIFIQAWQMTAIQEQDSEDKEQFYGDIFKGYSGVFFIIVSIIIIVQRKFVFVVFSNEYYESWKVIPFLLIASMYNSFSNFLGQIYISEKKTRAVFRTTLVSAVFTVLGNFFLIPLVGLIGAGIAQMFGWFVAYIYRLYDLKKIININFDSRNILFEQTLIIFQIIVLFLFKDDNMIFWVMQLILFFFIILLNRIFLTKIGKIVKRRF